MQLKNNITFAHEDLSKVSPRYNEDLIITNNIWKPDGNTVKYVETNPACYNVTLLWRSQRHNLPRFNEYFVCVEANRADDH